MKKFIYITYNKNKERKLSQGYFKDLTSLKTYLKNNDLILLNYKESFFNLHFFTNPVKKHKKIKQIYFMNFFKELSLMLESGIPLLKSLNILNSSSDNVSFKNFIAKLISYIEAGNPIHVSLKECNTNLNELYINMICIGEQSGKLPLVLNLISNNIKKNEIIKKKLSTILIYPISVIILTTLISIFLMTNVLPEFIKIFKQSNLELPIITKILLFFYDILKNYYFYILIFTFLILLFFYKYFNTPKGKKCLYIFFTNFFFTRKIFRKFTVIKFLRNFSIILSSGITIFKGLELLISLEKNPILKFHLIEAHSSMKSGEKISHSFKNSFFFNNILISMIEIGETSGNLIFMIDSALELLSEEFDSLSETIFKLLEPLTIIFLGLSVGTVMLGIYLPIFDSIPSFR